jgi:TRAP-type mannitol/chloroaromatic compound transport system permease small subunit
MNGSRPDHARAPVFACVDTYCRLVDKINEWVGQLLGPMIVLVSAAIVYEVVARSAFGRATVWANETVVYGSAAVYLLAGGYALLHRRHVRIDAIFGFLSVRTRRLFDLLAMPFLVAYALTLIVVGGELAWNSFLQAEGTGTPWNPRIWPIKACIPIAGVLLLAQAIANLLRDLGVATNQESRT